MPHHRSGGGQLSQGTAGTLQQKRETHAPDGGAIVDYPKGWRFLPSDMTEEQRNQMKNNGIVAAALKRLHDLSFVPQTKQYNRDPSAPMRHMQQTQEKQQIVQDYYNKLVIQPRLKAQAEALQKKEEMERQAIVTLKMRVQELEQKQEPEPTSPNYLPLALIPVVIIGAVLLLRRRG